MWSRKIQLTLYPKKLRRLLTEVTQLACKPVAQPLPLKQVLSFCRYRPKFSSISLQRTVSCGPSYGSRACFPDPLDLWVSTYQRLRLEDEVEEKRVEFTQLKSVTALYISSFSSMMQIATKRRRLLKRQELRAAKPHRESQTDLSDPFKQSRLTSDRTQFGRHQGNMIPNLPINIHKLDTSTLNQALDSLCRKLHQHSLIATKY